MMTTTDLLSASTSVLEAGGYQPIRAGFPEWDTTSTRLFEDKYNVVGVAVFTTISELLQSWADWQGALVDVISRYVGQTESKAWDGYLVLLTTAISPGSDANIESIRSDTTRLRKLVATGDDLASPGDIDRLLRSLLPLRESQESVGQRTALDLLPELLEEHGLERPTTELLVKSLIEQAPLMEALQRTWEVQ